ncbi:MAG: ribonuclease P protein component [Simkaniaceae bacterium]|nr:ribonuclease P protein component [Simkaniaceae bacterium]
MEEKLFRDSAVKAARTSGFKFPRALRIKKRFEFKRLSASGTRLKGSHIFIEYRKGKFPHPRLGLTVTKKFGKAHDRFRFKRQVREAFRHLAPFIGEPVEINVRPKIEAATATSQEIFDDLYRLLAETQSRTEKGSHNN